MSKEISGNIPYKLKISDEGEWLIEYESDINNDMASLAIAQRVMKICAIKLREDKNAAEKNREEMHLSALLKKVISARFGLQIICDYMLGVYEDYTAYLKTLEDGKPE